MATDMIARALAAKAMQSAAGASEKEPLIVTFTVTDLNTFALNADTPYADIVKAANAGRIVYAFIPEPLGPLFGQLSVVSDPELLFNAFNENGQIMTINMRSDSDIYGMQIKVLYRLSDAVGGGSFDAGNHRIAYVSDPIVTFDAANKRYADNIMTAGNSDSVVIKSSTPDSTKKFRITVDDAGAITATEVV